MKFILLFCFIFILVISTEQELVVFKTPAKHMERSLETLKRESSEDIGLDPNYSWAIDDNIDFPSSSNKEAVTDKISSSLDKEILFGDEVPAPVTKNAQKESESGLTGIDYGSGEDQTVPPPPTVHGTDKQFDKGVAIFVLKFPNQNFPKLLKSANVSMNSEKKTHWHRWASEIAAGNVRETSGTNPDTYQPNAYLALNRRFVLQYPYTEEAQNVMEAPDNKEIVPIEAPLDVVQKVAKQSAIEEAAKPQDGTADLVRNKILRTGEYWNEIWVEEVDPKAALRMTNNPVLGIIKAKIKPGSEFYDMVAGMRKISPRLLYIINDNEERRSSGINDS